MTSAEREKERYSKKIVRTPPPGLNLTVENRNELGAKLPYITSHKRRCQDTTRKLIRRNLNAPKSAEFTRNTRQRMKMKTRALNRSKIQGTALTWDVESSDFTQPSLQISTKMPPICLHSHSTFVARETKEKLSANAMRHLDCAA
jgi:hypothetical protein